jgi:hypothetical protein
MASAPTLIQMISLPGLRALCFCTSAVIWPPMAEEAPWMMIWAPSLMAALTLSAASDGPP